MNLFTTSGIAVRRDGTPADNVIEVRAAELDLSIIGDVLNYRSLGPSGPEELLPVIELNNEADVTIARVDDIDLTGPAGDTFELSLGFVTTPQGTAIIIAFFDETTNTDFIFRIGGDDAVVLPTTVAGFNALDASITNGGQVTFGPFAPNQNIQLSAFENTTSVVLPDGELFTGTNGNDTLLGGTGNDTLNGLAGDDVLDGAGGNDTLDGGDGNDQLTGGAGSDLIRTGENNPDFGDFVLGSSGNDTVDFGGLVDGFAEVSYAGLAAPIIATVDGAANTGTVNKGAQGTDTLLDVENPMFSGFINGGLRIRGTSGDDIFNFNTTANQWISARGFGGSDTYNLTGAGLVQLDLRGTAVTADLVAGTIVQGGNTSTINGTVFEIRTGNESDSLLGSAADDSFRVGGGNDTVDGGAGFDRLRYDDFGVTQVNANLATGIVTGTANGQAFTDTISNIEWLRGSTGDDVLIGNDANNRLQGRSGDDRLVGGLGNDTIDGEDGSDTAVLAVNRADARVSAINNGIQIISAEGTDFFTSVEFFQFDDSLISAADLINGAGIPGEEIVGTDGDDSLIGTVNDDTLAGGTGNDNIDSGGGGNNNISGSDGNDTLFGGPGDDSIGGGLGNDTIFGNNGNDVLGAGFGNDFVSGGNGNDVVAGGAGDDTLEGGEGNDSMSGSFGNDLIFGNGGADDIGGGTGRDTIDAGAGNDRVGGGEGDDSIDGGDGNDFLAGGGRDDTIDGGAGNDTINAGAGNDVITGGAGSDQFVFASFFDGEADVITDFEDGLDSFFIRRFDPDTGLENINNGGNGLAGFVTAMNIIDTDAGAQMTVNGNTILVEGITAAQLTVDDFQFL
ncbi:calcium-binding protein [Roseovarius sp.]|uniref:calcium-binding protein n=1 Tax=Roseovarius sp. TaxID=1486281 RepID=UPI001B4931F0|nr:calcium-binding protein [Roseovarius sp.]MBQ0809475.1 calcium-binding protein [Roseovarius sp.]